MVLQKGTPVEENLTQILTLIEHLTLEKAATLEAMDYIGVLNWFRALWQGSEI